MFRPRVEGPKSKVKATTGSAPAWPKNGRLWLRGALLGLILSLMGLTRAPAATIEGVVLDPGGSPVPSAKVSLLNSLALLEERQTDARGRYRFEGLRAGTYKLLASLPGFSTSTAEVSLQESDQRSLDLKLQISALQQQVVVSASLGGGALIAQNGSSVSIVSHQEIEDRGAQSVLEALRGIPGVEVNQTGRRGGVTGVFIRGGNSNYNLVMIDGVELNQFGGDFDFAPLAVNGVDRVEVTRGPESALYGSNAVTGVVDIISRRGEGPPHFSALAEGGSYATRRFATGGSGLTRGLSWAYDVSRMDTHGVVRNDNYRDQSAFASLGYAQGQRRQFDFHFFGNANDAGAPGPFGSDPDHLYDAPIYPTGPTPREVGLTARDKQNLFAYQGNYSEQFSERFRQVATASFATNDYYFSSILGDSFSNNFRGAFNTRSEISLSSKNLLVGGFEYSREQIKNTYIANNSNTPFLLPRTSLAYFAEDRWNPTRRWYLTGGVRIDDIRTAGLPAQFVRPLLPASSVVKVNPRLAVAYLAHQPTAQDARVGATRLHGSFGTGIRPPDGFELAFTDNPHLKPEESVSFDFGVEQRLWGDRLLLDVTYFFNRFRNQIVVLGGSLTSLSNFMSDNLANARAQGVEAAFRMRPRHDLEVQGGYTYLDSAVLALNKTDLAQFPFQVGQPLIRRPRNSAAYNITWRRRRLTLNTDAYFRGKVLDLEPNDGAFACTPPPLGPGLPCLFNNKAYARADAGFAYRFPRGIEIYGRLNNFLNQKYEESFGFPALRLNFLAGVRFSFPGE